MLSDLRYRFRALFNRRAMERELDDELRFHVERETDKLIARGFAPVEAARRATIAFGGMNRIKDDARDARGVALWDSIRQDMAYAARGLRAHPGFTAAVTIALAVGIGANAAMGATGGDVMRLILGHGVRFAIIGVAIGSVVALWASRWIQPLLFNQAARDPAIMIGAGSLLLVVAVAASARPAIRASKVNPSQVLQSD